MGIAADARDYSALADTAWFENLVASGFKLSQPVGVFPRLELPVAEEVSA
jgi:methionyl-tRNA synthetase